MRESRDASGNVLSQYFNRGQTSGSVHYLITKDLLGSTKEMTDSAGNIQAQYAYDPYGRATQLSGTLSSDFQYGGYYFHASSQLGFALHRAYKAVWGRWINRDPIGEKAGTNRYAYVGNEPIRRVDPSGLDYLIAGPGYYYDPTQNNCIGYASGIGFSVNPGPGQSFSDFIPQIPGNVRCYALPVCGCGPGRYSFKLTLWGSAAKGMPNDPWTDVGIGGGSAHAYVPCDGGGVNQITGDQPINSSPTHDSGPYGPSPSDGVPSATYCCCSDNPPKGGPSPGCSKN